MSSELISCSVCGSIYTKSECMIPLKDDAGFIVLPSPVIVAKDEQDAIIGVCVNCLLQREDGEIPVDIIDGNIEDSDDNETNHNNFNKE